MADDNVSQAGRTGLEVSSKQVRDLPAKTTLGVHRVFAVKPVKESLDV